MSASTASIAANPASTARQRPVVVGDKRSGIEFLSREAILPESHGLDADNVSGGRDLGNLIRGETGLDRSKESVNIKKGADGSAVLPRRSRRVSAQSEKPRWRTLLRVRTKNLLLILVLLGFARMVWKLLLNSDDNSLKIPTMASDFEVRIAELNALLKETAKMLQLQVEVVDRKFVNEIGGLTQEFNKKIEEKSVELANEVGRLDSRTEGLENAVNEMKSMDFLTKEGFEKFYNELKLLKGDGVVNKVTTLDDVRAAAKMVVEKEIERHAADGLGMVDYALASGGGMVVMHSEPLITRKGGAWFYLKNSNGVHSEAVKMLKPSFGEPGECFPLKGSSGFVQIRLRAAIVPQAVTLEHVSKSVAYDRSSAPKECRISGWMKGPNPEATDGPDGKIRLVEFTYDLERSNAQTFKVADSGDLSLVDMVQLDIASNHGSPTHTCIYRLRVHGREPSSLQVLAAQP